MSLTTKDMQEIAKLFEPSNDRLDRLETGHVLLEERMDTLEERMDKLEENQSNMYQELRSLNRSVAVLEAELIPKIQIILDNLVALNDRDAKITRLEEVQEDHGVRIFALEEAVKK